MGTGSSGLGGQTKTKIFSQKYDVSNLSDDDINNIAEGMINDDVIWDYDAIGIRSVEPKYAESLRPSYVWDNGYKTNQKLEGVSALNTGIRYGDDANEVSQKLKKAIHDASQYVWGSRKPFIVLGNDAYGGEDINEIVIKDPKILDISKYIKR